MEGDAGKTARRQRFNQPGRKGGKIAIIEIIENILINEHEYNLICTAVHVGAQEDGHYVSFVKKRNKWFFINDEMVREEELPDEAGFYFMVYNLKATI